MALVETGPNHHGGTLMFVYTDGLRRAIERRRETARPTDWAAPLGPRGGMGGEHALRLSMGLLIEGAPPIAARSVNVAGDLGFQCRTIR